MKKIFIMETEKLLELMQNEGDLYDLKGEFSLLNDNEIVWSFKLDDINNHENESFNYIDDEESYGFFETLTLEEQLQETYLQDYNKICLIIDKIDNSINWDYSEPEVSDDIISFQIFKN